MAGGNMVRALEDRINENEGSQLNAQQLAEVLNSLKPGEISRGLNRKLDEIKEIPGLEDALQQLIEKHATNPHHGLDETSINGLYALFDALQAGGEGKVRRREIKRNTIDEERSEEARAKIRQTKIQPLLDESGITYDDREFWQNTYDKSEKSLSRQIGSVAVAHEGSNFFIPFNFAGTFDNHANGLKVLNEDGEKEMFARINKDKKLVLETEEQNQEWRDFVALAEEFPSIPDIETRIGERTITILNTRNTDFIDDVIQKNQEFLAENKVDSKDFTALVEEYAEKSSEFDLINTEYKAKVKQITEFTNSMSQDQYTDLRMSRNDFHNWQNDVRAGLIGLLDTGEGNFPQGRNESKNNDIVNLNDRGLGEKRNTVEGELNTLGDHIASIRELFIAENKEELWDEAPQISINRDGEIDGATNLESHRDTDGGEDLLGVSLYGERLAMGLQNGTGRVRTRQFDRSSLKNLRLGSREEASEALEQDAEQSEVDIEEAIDTTHKTHMPRRKKKESQEVEQSGENGGASDVDIAGSEEVDTSQEHSEIATSTYIVQAGDMLFKIARDHNTTLAKIKTLNPNLFQDGIDDTGRMRREDGLLIYPDDEIKLFADSAARTEREQTTDTGEQVGGTILSNNEGNIDQVGDEVRVDDDNPTNEKQEDKEGGPKTLTVNDKGQVEGYELPNEIANHPAYKEFIENLNNNSTRTEFNLAPHVRGTNQSMLSIYTHKRNENEFSFSRPGGRQGVIDGIDSNNITSEMITKKIIDEVNSNVIRNVEYSRGRLRNAFTFKQLKTKFGGQDVLANNTQKIEDYIERQTYSGSRFGTGFSLKDVNLSHNTLSYSIHHARMRPKNTKVLGIADNERKVSLDKVSTNGILDKDKILDDIADWFQEILNTDNEEKQA